MKKEVAMNQYVTAKEMKEMEYQAFKKGVPYLAMMENAGKAAYEEIRRRHPLKGKNVIVLTGKGNNGGDGYVVARYCAEAGAHVQIIMAEGNPVTEDAKVNFSRCLDANISINQDEVDVCLNNADMIIDAIYGAGFYGSFHPDVSSIVQKVNQSGKTVIALDLPSGLNADTGEADIHSISATITIAFARLKLAHQTENGKRLCGEIVLVDIGI